MQKISSTMEKVAGAIEKNLMPIFQRVADIAILSNISDSMLAIVPFFIIGSIFLMLVSIPVISDIVAPYAEMLTIPAHLTMDLMALYIVISLAYTRGSYKGLDPIACVLASVMTFLLIVTPTTGDLGAQYLGFFGMLWGIITPLVSVEVYDYMKKHGLILGVPPGVPPGVIRMIEVIFPMSVLLSVFWIIRVIFNVDLTLLVSNIVQPLFSASDNYLTFLFLMMGDAISIWFGIHPFATTMGVAFPMLIANQAANAEAYALGQPLPHMLTLSSYNMSYWGGMCYMFIPNLLNMFSKSKRLKYIGRLGFPAGFTGIVETTWFGTPIALNPYFIIPVLVTPFFGVTTTYVAMEVLNIIPRTFAFAPNFVPFQAPLEGLIATGFTNWMIVPVLLLGTIVFPLIVYYPFWKIYEKRVIAEEAEAEAKAEK